jgi:hypothetical protein
MDSNQTEYYLFLREKEKKKYAGQILTSLRAFNWLNRRFHGWLWGTSNGKEERGTINI